MASSSTSSSTTTSPPSTTSHQSSSNNHSNQSSSSNSVAYYYGELKTGRRPLPPAPSIPSRNTQGSESIKPIIPSNRNNGPSSHINAFFVDGSSCVDAFVTKSTTGSPTESTVTVNARTKDTETTTTTSFERQESSSSSESNNHSNTHQLDQQETQNPFVTSVSIDSRTTDITSPTTSSSSGVGVTTLNTNNNHDNNFSSHEQQEGFSRIPLVSGSSSVVGSTSIAVSPTPGPSTSSLASSSSNHPHLHNSHHQVPPPAAFANPLLGIEADTRCSFETLSRSCSSRKPGIIGDKSHHHHRNHSNSSHLSNSSNTSSSKAGIYQRSLTLLANGVSPLLKKRNPSIASSVLGSSTINQGDQRSSNREATEQIDDKGRRGSEPTMYGADSTANEIIRLRQKQEQLRSEIVKTTIDFNNMLLTDEDNFGQSKQSQLLPGLSSNNGQHQQSSQLSSPTSSSSANNQRSGQSSSSGHANHQSSGLMPSSEYGSRGGQQLQQQQIPQHLQQHTFNSQQHSNNPHQQSHHLSQQLFKEPLYMMYGDDNYGRGGSTGGGPEENIYEEVDLMTLSSLRAQYADTLSLQSWKKKGGSKRALSNAASNSFSRWFSTRKKSPLVGGPDEENPYTMDGGKMSKKQRPPISLPDIPPEGLSQEQLKRRYILSSIVESENSYISSLHRLINEYKKPLEDSAPNILSQNKINIIFHRLEQILQHHAIFGITLNQCVREWDQKERLGDVFTSSFSKPMVLDIYSDFINNFTNAMETARKASKSKSAFAQFLQEKSLSSPDRLSFFGLMVKPVQRFPQFILLLNDLLKHTPAEHPDRMSLQLALTQLESLADRLNERKRDAERHFAVKQLLKDYLSSASSSPNRYLLRMDEVFLLDLDASTGLVVKVTIFFKDETMNDRDNLY